MFVPPLPPPLSLPLASCRYSGTQYCTAHTIQRTVGQRPRAFETIIMYMEGGILTPPSNMSLDEFIDELLFYEIANLDGAIQAYADRFDDDSDTESSEDETDDEIRTESCLRRWQRITHIIMDGEVEELATAHNIERDFGTLL